MDILSKLTLKEIEIFKEKLRISEKNEDDYYKKIPQKLMDDLKRDLNKEVWNDKNLKKCIEFTNSLNQKNDSSIGYIGAAYTGNLNKNICRSSLYLEKMVIDDPMCVSLMNPVSNQEDQSSYIYSSVRSIANLKEWVESDIVKVYPFSSKHWYENYELKKIMTEQLSNFREEGFDFIVKNTNLLDTCFKSGLFTGSPDDDIDFYINQFLEGSLLETDQLIYFSKMMNFITTVDDYDQWSLLNWKLEKGVSKNNNDTTNVLALQNLNMKYLDTISTDLALKVRENEYGLDLRYYFMEKFKEINKVSSKAEFDSLISNISSEIDYEVYKYEKDMASLSKSSLIRIAGEAAIGIMGMGISASYGLPLEPVALATLLETARLGVGAISNINEKSDKSLSLLLDAKKSF